MPKPTNRLAVQASIVTPDFVIAHDWHHRGTTLAVALSSGPVLLIDPKSGAIQQELPGHGFGTMSVQFQPNGNLVATAGQDGTAKMWDSTTGELKSTLAGGAAWVEHVAWKPDGNVLATAAGKIARLWSSISGELLAAYGPQGSTIADIAWQPGTDRLSVAAYGGVNLYQGNQLEPVQQLNWKGSILKLCWSRDGKFLTHGNQDASIHYWNAGTGRELHMSGYPEKVNTLSWDTTSRYLVTGGGDAACLWDCGGVGPEGRTPRMLEQHIGVISGVAWQHRGYLVATADVGGKLNLWQPASKTPLVGGATLKNVEITGVSWSPDDRALAVTGHDGTVAIFRVV
jgi:WD40 repeat protein